MPGILVYATLGLALVLALRKPARRAFGAGPAFTLWLLPPLLALLPWLPSPPATWTTAPSLLVLPASTAIDELILPAGSTPHGVTLLWLIGVLGCVLRLALGYERVLRQSNPLPAGMLRALQADLGDLDPGRLRLHPAGPAVLWAPRSRVLLRPDFLGRFDAHERRLMLQHELAHLRRGDAWWSLLADLAAALLWFHPLVWLALPRLRLDQELACDDRVLRRAPQDERKYAHTLLHSAGMNIAPVLIPWLSEPQLKERLNMIQRHRPGTLRRRLGFIAMAAMMAGGAFATQALVPAQPDQPASADLSYNTLIQPHYPADAIKNNQQGTVILDVLVGADGKPRTVRAEPAPQVAASLVKAATDTAMLWHFHPTTRHGKAVEGHARVPVKFSLAPLPPAPPKGSSSF
ncbi:TonB family protein [Rhodanobacter umsongensis]|uniref:TonB family protein n=1 Tax=Rhodanobacter umsongensis TaxID=633153 RepID=A0ABW0JPG8_9GAMM